MSEKAPERLTPEQEAKKQECLRRAAVQLARVTVPGASGGVPERSVVRPRITREQAIENAARVLVQALATPAPR